MSEPVETDVDHEIVYTVKIRTFGRDNEEHRLSVAGTLGRHLNHAFGVKRFEIWSEGQRLLFGAQPDA